MSMVASGSNRLQSLGYCHSVRALHKRPSFKHATCSFHYRCDPRCHYFGECCFDAPEPLDFTKPTDLLKYVCVLPGSEIQGTQGYALIATCPTGSDPRQQRLCEQGVYGEWNPLGWPVYDNSTKLE